MRSNGVADGRQIEMGREVEWCRDELRGMKGRRKKKCWRREGDIPTPWRRSWWSGQSLSLMPRVPLHNSGTGRQAAVATTGYKVTRRRSPPLLFAPSARVCHSPRPPSRQCSRHLPIIRHIWVAPWRGPEEQKHYEM
ncbi:hypothetical protein Pcinc_036376 [Petrolisthes cinctipes]|uniref:Uncharacterized protein n=1 Tax=Petrolisthes cinctipes TaxID=88211 RepID=A0AAE1EM19_PETCI|nr:hypothetical protein Pcinc_036376 [Petrolisthes cinctipes]